VIVLDTDILSILNYQEGTSYDRAKMHLASVGDELLCTTIISIEEQLRGWLSYIAASKKVEREIEGYLRLQTLLDDIGNYAILSFAAAAAMVFASLRKQRVRVGTMELKIAAIAISNDAAVATANAAHFARIPGVKLLDWR